MDRPRPEGHRDRGGACGAERRPAGLRGAGQRRGDEGDLQGIGGRNATDLRTRGGVDKLNAEEDQAQTGGEQAPRQPTQDEMRERLEEQLRRVRVQDLLLESVVSVLNLEARRIAKEDERDLEQGRIGIEAVRAVVGLLDPEPAAQVRSALSEVQMLYAKQAEGGGEPPPEGGGEPESGGEEPPPGGGQERGPSRLWTPPGT